MKLATSIIRLAAACMLLASQAWANQSPADPLESVRWADMERVFFKGEKYVFDPAVKVDAPDFAESPLQVPVTIDATALSDVKQILVFADFNPIVEILRFYPDATPAFVSFRAKLQQTTQVRAAALTADGVWHVGGTVVNTVGGGCTAPSFGSGSPEWQRRLNEVTARSWNEGPLAGRVRLRIIHPMDTGLVAGIPEFYLESLSISDDAGKQIARMAIFQPVSENPVFTLYRGDASGALQVKGRDNNGNSLSVRVK